MGMASQYNSTTSARMSLGMAPETNNQIMGMASQTNRTTSAKPSLGMATHTGGTVDKASKRMGMAPQTGQMTVEYKDVLNTYGGVSGNYFPRNPYPQNAAWREQQRHWAGYEPTSLGGMPTGYKFYGNTCGISPTKEEAPFFQRLQNNFPWWEANTNNPQVLRIIQEGVMADFPLPPKLSRRPSTYSVLSRPEPS